MIIIILGYLTGLFPMKGFANAQSNDENSCEIETIDFLLEVREYTSNWMDRNHNNNQYALIDQVYDAFINDFVSIDMCHESIHYDTVVDMLKSNNLRSQSNMITTVTSIDKILASIHQNWASNGESNHRIGQKTKPTEQVTKIPLNKAIESLLEMVQQMLELSVKLTTNSRISNGSHLKNTIHFSARKCVQTGKRSGHPLIKGLTQEFLSIHADTNKQLMETIQLLDHTLWVLNFLDVPLTVCDSNASRLLPVLLHSTSHPFPAKKHFQDFCPDPSNVFQCI